ncbi:MULTISPECIES: FMN-binding negative transcriptional regulator [Streptosporangium]|uniref:Transcriptional regulator n=1 Tax=Streptosporangium brasiliense TaxID=47480 RepID=A0ABT9RH67_9ACTN|nr:FMN-binding negative transcriptional regulator [Streptosporangium brasiliense]MDP9868069.1 transcriptional regulator [Streptosporangium brasiliense]
MYVPHFNAMDDLDEVRALVTSVGSAELITVGDDGYPLATLLPVIWDEDRLVFHMARANPQWRSIQAHAPALAVVTGPQAYISAAWYASKAEHGRTVPTWNYSAVHFTGRLRVHQDADWLLEAVTRLTDRHEQRRDRPWAVGDAPEQYIDRQLRAIVGIEFAIERIEGKAKLSQNRSDADYAGVIEGLRREGGGREHQVADSMAELR